MCSGKLLLDQTRYIFEYIQIRAMIIDQVRFSNLGSSSYFLSKSRDVIAIIRKIAFAKIFRNHHLQLLAVTIYVMTKDR